MAEQNQLSLEEMLKLASKVSRWDNIQNNPPYDWDYKGGVEEFQVLIGRGKYFIGWDFYYEIGVQYQETLIGCKKEKGSKKENKIYQLYGRIEQLLKEREKELERQRVVKQKQLAEEGFKKARDVISR